MHKKEKPETADQKLASQATGTLYIVATPIGNLADLSERARQTLQSVDLILAEDTRHSRVLLQHCAIKKPLQSLHAHNESSVLHRTICLIGQGRQIALVSDAGTPLISDPGYRLVLAAHKAHCRVVPIPGACSVIAALSAAGMVADRFVFEGYLPQKTVGRKKVLAALRHEPRTMVFFEAPHRLEASLADFLDVLGSKRSAALFKELTKHHETIKRGSLEMILAWVRAHPEHRLGEFVLVVSGAQDSETSMVSGKERDTLRVLLNHLPLSKAVEVASEVLGRRSNTLYKQALELQRTDH